ncbi:uncharacterized protein PV09_01600 [Verruconis gallopava]|uniref:Uncharacterized protein n=1 Tax=Verruconis gallopava TaxID=253628 RepID=A0A0D2AMG4_9PEZI|nr:uncharacterized protein PV09_01600 [Verruconis gallopava]KIW07660.1 hypothetical protein PV09_01600 [Verruconis gallopava]
METNLPQPTDTTVGRAETPPVLLRQTPHRSLAGALTGTHVAQANSAKRRLYGPTLLQSPPRRGHSSRMGDVFSDAKASISVPTTSRVPRASDSIPLPLCPRPASAFNKEGWQAHQTGRSDVGADLYPVLPQDDAFPVSKPGTKTPMPIPGLENGRQTFQTTRFYRQVQEAHSRYPGSRLSPAPGVPQHSYFNGPPKIASAQIVAMHDIETMRKQEELSSSSASWTGDSEFYVPPQRAFVLPSQERKSSIPEWLERLPAEPEEFETEELSGEDEIVPLSPHVEIERGSMRKRMRGNEGRIRRCSLVEENKHAADEQED